MPATDAIAATDAVPILDLSHRQLVEQHVGGLRLRHSYDARRSMSDDGDSNGALSLEDLAVVHGVDRYSVPALVRLSSAGDSSAASLNWSASLSSTMSSSLGASLTSSPDHELANTRVRFTGVATTQNGHCEFLVQVETGKEQFVVHKRFSEFRDLRLQILNDLQSGHHCSRGACTQLEQITAVKFPRRKVRLLRVGKRQAKVDLDTARDRVAPLQRFVEAILRVYRMAPRRQVRCCVNAKCKVLSDIRGFLDLLDLCPSVDASSDEPMMALPVAPPAELSAKLNDSAVRPSEHLYTISEDLESLHVQ